MGRKTNDWLSSYLEFTKEQESPEVFHFWCGATAISAALERHVYIDRGYYQLFSNLYVVLVAKSAVARKSTAIGIARKTLLRAIPEYPILSQKITTEALISALHASYKKRKISSGLAVASELGVFLGKHSRDKDILDNLTDIYDCYDPFTYHTMGRGKEVCGKPYLCILGGTTPEWVRDSIPSGAIGAGFTSRVMFVYARGGWKRNAFPELTPEMLELWMRLVEDLRDIGELKGKFEFSPRAREYYGTWYEEIYRPSLEAGQLTGYFGRKQDSLLKLAMIIAVSRREGLVLEEEDIVAALELLTKTERELPEIMEMIQTTQVGEDSMHVLMPIRKAGGEGIPHTALLRKLSYRFNAKQLGEIVSTLIESEMIVRKKVGRSITYVARM